MELLLNLEELGVGDSDEQQKPHQTRRILEWLWKLTSGASVVVSYALQPELTLLLPSAAKRSEAW